MRRPPISPLLPVTARFVSVTVRRKIRSFVYRVREVPLPLYALRKEEVAACQVGGDPGRGRIATWQTFFFFVFSRSGAVLYKPECLPLLSLSLYDRFLYILPSLAVSHYPYNTFVVYSSCHV